MTSATANDGRIYDGDARAAQERAARLGHPIGVPNATSTDHAGVALDHSAEERQRAAARAPLTEGLTTADQFKGIAVVPELTPTPDEVWSLN